MRIKIVPQEAVGSVELEFPLYTNDRARPVIRLRMSARVRALADYASRLERVDLTRGMQVGELNVWPGIGPLIRVEPGESVQLAIRVRPAFASALDLELKPPSAGNSFTLARERDGPGYWLELKAPALDRGGNATHSVAIVSGSGQEVQVAVSVVAVADNLTVTPRELDLGELSPARIRAAPRPAWRVGIRKQVGRFDVTGVTSDLPFLRFSIQSIVDGSNYLVRVQLDPDEIRARGGFTGVVKIHVKDEITRVVEVPVRGTFRD